MSPHLSRVSRRPRVVSAVTHERPTIAAVIVSWRTGPYVFACLEAALSAPDIDEVIFVDNGNPRDTRVKLIHAAAIRKDFRIVWGQGNVGFAKGCNLGAQHANSQRLLFLNPDAVIAPGAASALAEAGESAARPWVAGGRVVGTDGVEQRGARRGDITLWSAFVEMTGLTRFSDYHSAFSTVHYENQPLPSHPTAVSAVSGACMMMRADDFRAVGGFDERYFVHVEDVDLCRRAREAGGDVVFTPDAQVVHEGATSDASSTQVAWYKGVSFAKYFMKFAQCASSRVIAAIMAPVIIFAALIHALARTNIHKNGYTHS